MGSGARVFWAFLFASAAVMLTVGLIAAFGTTLWQADGVSLCVADGWQQYSQIASDGSGGAVVAWRDARDYGTNSYDIYAQRIYSDGTAVWATDGLSLCVDSSGQYIPQIVSDGSGGAIVTWQDRRSGSGNDDIYAQRVDDNGNALWQADGVSLCVAADSQSLPQIASDESGGAIVTWQDRRSGGGNYDIYAQRVYLDGTVWYTDGISICVAATSQWEPQIVSDGSGGAIVTWEDNRDIGTSGPDIYAQWVDADGNTRWQTDGVSLCVATGGQYTPQIVSDGLGGAIVTWEDRRSDSGDIYAQRVDPDGNALWQAGGVSLCVAADRQRYPQIAPDGSGGAIVTWQDGRSGTDDNIYAQRVDSGGNAVWQADGVSLCGAADDQYPPQIAPDGSGGAIVTWSDHRSDTDDDIYAQRVNANGNTLWQADGVRACGAADDQTDPYLVYDGAEGAIVTWWDYRGSATDIYVQRVSDLIPTDFVRLPLVAKKYPG